MFQSKFKAITNNTINKYINTIRIERAKQLIREGELSLSEIGYSVGFSSASYFSTVFKQNENISPKGYVDKIHNEDSSKNSINN